MFDVSADTTGWVLTALLAAAFLVVVAGMAARWLRR
jgi:hypothetical protein